MFRLLPSGLPKDPVFPADLQGLGYFINEKDEIRMINNPKAYFKFFLTKNERYNCMQREAMNECIRTIVTDRLLELGLEKVCLPPGTAAHEPNIPIFVSSSLFTKKRVIILFYEHNQDLGVLAIRVVGGQGGINGGSAIDFVKYIQALNTSSDNADSPGMILANMGQLRWWRRGKKAVTQTTWYSLPSKSAVDNPYHFDADKNTVAGNRSTEEHVDYIFNNVIKTLVDPEATLDILGVSDGAFQASKFLNSKQNWTKWGNRINAFAALATYFDSNDISNTDFREWMKKRGRAYLLSPEPCGTFLAGPEGHKRVIAYGCPAFSLGEPYYSERMLPVGYKTVVDWFQEVAANLEYENPAFQRFDHDDAAGEGEEGGYDGSFKEGGVDFDAVENGSRDAASKQDGILAEAESAAS